MKPAFVLALALVGCSAAATPPTASRAPSSAPQTLRELYHLPPVTAIDPAHTALVLVDFQDEFVHGKLAIADAPAAIARARELLDWARSVGLAIVHVRNVTKPGAPMFAPDSPSAAIVAELAPRDGEIVLAKPTGGAFTKTELDAILRARGVDMIVAAGIMAHLALAMTAEDATVLGYRVVVASDATTTRDLPGIDRATLERAALATIADRFADVLPTRAIVALPTR